ncbi:GNAT family N-acetyltransferase [Marivita sp.]|uniref:GNAT family N-acetyltransferase n=1 Tax=Marivita sp. TaxID=2003365 RepID=UPI003219D9D0
MLPNPLPQSDAYANTLRALGTGVQIHTIGDQGRCLIQTRHFPVIGPVNLISRGPVGLSPSGSADYLRALDMPGPLVINTNNFDIPVVGKLMLAKPKSVALLSLSDPTCMRANLHQNWRNALKKAEHSGLHVTNTAYHPNQHAWLIAANAAQQKTQHYRNWPTRLLNTFASENTGHARVITALDHKTPIAGMLILCHRPWATYHMGVTTDAGRRSNAHNLSLWQAMLWLAKRGYDTLDLGLLTGPDRLDRFKLRTGATRQQLGGTWLRLPRPFWRQFPSIHAPSGQKA